MINAMEMSGRMDSEMAKPLRLTCKRVLYGLQGWEGQGEDGEEAPSLALETSGSPTCTATSSIGGTVSSKGRLLLPRIGS